MKRVYLSLGSNIGDRQAHLREGIDLLPASGIQVLRVSPVYETEPIGYAAQAWFLNLVIEADTSLFPVQLLNRTQRIEHTLGRIRTIPNGPRRMDIDILLYANAVIHTTRLEIPHPRLAERRFVLQPLADLAPGLRHPVNHRTVRELLDSAPPQIVRLLD